MFLLTQSTHRMVIQHDPDVGHRFTPNLRARIPGEDGGYFVVTNSLGFRSDFEFGKGLPTHGRILMFGDSYTAGDCVSNCDRYSDQLAGILGVEVQNYGVPGSGTDQHLLIHRKFARDVEADAVVVCVQIDSFHRIQVPARPSIDRITGRRVLVPKPYFQWENGQLALRNVPTPKDRLFDDGDESVETGKEKAGWYDALHNAYLAVPGLKEIRHSRPVVDLGSKAISALHRVMDKHPYPDIRSDSSPGWKLMSGILRKFIEEVRPRPIAIVPIPTQEFYIHGVKPVYQRLFQTLEDRGNGVHVLDVTTPLIALPWTTRQKLAYEFGGHFTPMANRIVAESMATQIRERNVLGPRKTSVAVDGLKPARLACPPAARSAKSIAILGISCFYHNSAAALIRDGEIVAAAEEERFTRVKNDRRFPHNAINFCLEQAGISQKELSAIVYYDNSSLTFERLCHSVAAVERDPAERMWRNIMPSWLRMKLHLPKLIRSFLKYDGLILQGVHHRSHAASCFYPSPFERAAILTIDGVGEWATASIGRGAGNRVELLREMRFPNSLGLLYSAFTEFTGFKVNSGEYKMMGLAPYGKPVYAQQILDHVVDLKDDGSVELNMEYFGFLREHRTTTEKFAELFGGPKRHPESRITRREIDLARSIQAVTEEAMLRMARTAKSLTGENRLCLAGGVALNCVANGRLLREGPFEDLWIQPAAGDSGCALGAALDVYHTYFGQERKSPEGKSAQGGSYLGPEFTGDEIEAYLETYGYPYRKLSGKDRDAYLVDRLKAGKVVGHLAGRLEFGPRALGARSILGDPRNPDMQASLNLRIKYRESFRPFAPAVLADKVGDYFELDRESPYMLLVAPVKEGRRLALDTSMGEDDDLLPVVRRLRSDIPAVTHVDYSARIQSVRREHHREYHDLIAEFERQTGCGVIVNTSFNVRGEPIVCTPADAYRCFMRTEMDVLALGDYILLKEEQPAWPEGKGEGLENEDVAKETKDSDPEELVTELKSVFDSAFWPAAEALKGNGGVMVSERFRQAATTWSEVAEPGDMKPVFEVGAVMESEDPDPAEFARLLTASWTGKAAAEALEPAVSQLVEIGIKHRVEVELDEKVSESVYVMF